MCQRADKRFTIAAVGAGRATMGHAGPRRGTFAIVSFTSDNGAGAAAEVMAALIAVNDGPAAAYGADPWTARLAERCAVVFEHPVTIFPVTTGTAANALALAALVPPYGFAYCHAEAHVQVDECGAPEFFTGGAKLSLLAGAHGKVTASALADALALTRPDDVHQSPAAAVSLTQATEAGTVYTPDEVRAVADTARGHGLRVQMDGARFANAVAHLGCAPADLTWRAGVDVLAFGGTKNGAIGAEVIIFFDPALAREVGFRRKRAGHLPSKARYISAQLHALLTDDLWLRHAAHANKMAARIAAGLAQVAAAQVMHPVEANEVFVRLPDAVTTALAADGFHLHVWGPGGVVRLVTAFDTQNREVDELLAALRRHATGSREQARRAAPSS